jgi:transposase
MHRGDRTNEQWARLEPLLPPQKPKTGRPNDDHRRIINGILWILRTGAPWEDLPSRYGTRGTVSRRSYRWRQAGVWDRIFADLQAHADADALLEWPIPVVDSTIVRAHQHAAGANRGTRKPKRAAAARAGSRPNCMCGLRVTANRWPLCSSPVRGTSARRSSGS